MNSIVSIEDLEDGEMKDQYLESEARALSLLLERLYRTILIIYETLDLRSGEIVFTSKFNDMRPNLGTVTYYDDDPDLPESLALNFLAEQVRTFSPLFHATKVVDAQRQILWAILEQTHVLVESLDIKPTKEHDIQKALEKVLKVAFPDSICHYPGALQSKVYRPDFVIESLDIAVELKFVAKEGDIGKIIGSIYEDMLAYADNPSWSKVYGVVFMTGPFLSQRRLEAELKKVKAPSSWKVCAVVGSPGPKVATVKKKAVD